MKKRNARLLSILVCAAMLMSMLPVTVSAEYDAEGTTYVRVNSVEDLVPNARYIILGEYEAEGVETDYFAMSTDVNTYDDIRVGLTSTTYASEENPNFVLSEDKQTLTLHSDSILKVRLRSATYGDHENLYKMEVDGGYLYGFCNSYYYYSTSCCRELAVRNSTKGQSWWRFRMGDNGYWQISTFMRANGDTSITSLVFNDVYRDFMSYCYVNGSGLAPELAFFQNFTEDKDTNILLYREVCTHKASDVTHVEAAAASCTDDGTLEYWFCAGCEKFSTKEDFSDEITMADTFIAPTPHTASCGHTGETSRFELDTDGFNSSSQHGERFILVGKVGDKYYAMGNVTNADGSRNAVEVTANANGILTASSHEAEFVTKDYDNGAFGFLVDGCYLSVDGGRIIAYDKSLYNTSGYIPRPAYEVLGGSDSSGYLCAYSGIDTKNKYMVFDAESLCFKAQSEPSDSLYFYKELCTHTHLAAIPEIDPTCTQQGSRAYWYCGDCNRYYTDSSLEIPLEYFDEEEFTKSATGHSYGDNGICTKCGMTRTYSQVSTLEAFDALDEDTTYIIVIKDGEKTYAAALPPTNPADVDSDGDGIVDPMEPDTNENGIPDCIENYIDTNWGGADADEDGTTTVEEYNAAIGDMNGDELVDAQDYAYFFEYNIYWEMSDAYYQETANLPNFVEVTMNEDGTITITDEAPMEFQMMAAGVWGGSPYDQEELESLGILETERIRAAWVPNYWVGYSGQMGYYCPDHFGTGKRVFGDSERPGTTDMKNWKISFNADGTACLVDTWEEYDNTAALQLAKYTDGEGNAAMTIVGLAEWLWEDSPIMSARTELLPVYLYAAGVAGAHTHIWGDWAADENGTTHTSTCTVEGCEKTKTEDHSLTWTSAGSAKHKGTCSGCGFTQEQAHAWGEGVETKAATTTAAGAMTYTCTVCSATKTEVIPKLPCEHVWTDWTTDGDENHKRTCTNDGCQAYQLLPHTWDEGAVTTEPTETAEGVTTYTCTVCGEEKTEAIPMLQHTHVWDAWTDDENGKTHTHSCTGATCTATETADHACGTWTDNTDGTHSTQCSDCGVALTQSHTWGNWVTGAEENQLVRTCTGCGATETMILVVNEPINTTTSTDNAAGATLDNTDLELINNVLTDEEQGALQDSGTTVSIYLEVSDVTEEDVPSANKAAAEEAAQQTEGTAQIGMYLDIELFKEVTTTARGSGENLTITETETTQVTQTSGKVKITINIPDELISNDDSVERQYRIIRVHEDENGNLITDVIEGDYDAENQTFTFETDKFSTYALVYAEESTALAGDADGSGVVDSYDATLISQYAAGWDVTIDLTTADVDGSGVVDSYDATLISQYAAGWDVILQ